ncbi:hypothetical protein ACROYT_G016290 [Oculina patagonica]
MLSTAVRSTSSGRGWWLVFLPPPSNGGKPCSGNAQDTQACNISPCPQPVQIVDGGWSSWSDWSACDKNCGGGSQQRTKTCSQPPPSNGGKPCIGDSNVTRSCNTGRCQWNKWSAWSKCNQTCGGGGLKMRTRTCQGTPPCGGRTQQTKACGKRKCHCKGQRQLKQTLLNWEKTK